MKLPVLAALVGAVGLAAATVPSQAAPTPAQGPGAADQGMVQTVQARSSAKAGNAAMPSRKPKARQYGNTSGGPRR